MKYLILFFLLSTIVFSQSNSIILDEDFEDWNNVTSFEEDANDNISNGVDFKKLWVTNDHDYLFIRIDF